MVFGRDNERQGLFTEEDFKRICEMSGCLPMVMSLICQQLFELRTGNKAVRWEVLEKSLADRTRNDYRYFWNEDLTDPDQRELLIRLGSEQGVPDSELGEDEEKQVERLEVVGLVVRTNNGKLKIVPGLRPVIEEALRKARRRNTGSLLSETYQTSQPPSVPPPAFRSGSFDEQWSQEESYRMALPAEAIQSSQANQNLQSTLISQLMEMLAGPRLDNYDGYLCAELKDSQTSEAMEWDGRNINAASGKEYQLYVWLDRQKPAGKLFDRVEINDGQKAADIKFQIAIDCDSLRFFPRQQDCLVNVGQYSSVLSFSCPVGEKKTNHQLWIQLFQKNRLIQVLPLQISVEGE